MESGRRTPNKLQKRKSREQQDMVMSGGLANFPPQANSSQPLAPADTMSSAEKEKRSKWRVSNPFHKDKGKDKDKEKEGSSAERIEPAVFTGDSAYASSEPNTSGHPSLTNNISHPLSSEQVPPERADLSSAAFPSQTPPHNHDMLAAPEPPLHNRTSQENIGRETYRDAGTGNIVTITTTTTTTTVTTTGPGGSTTVEQPTEAKGGNSITNTSGPYPPAPASPQPPCQHMHQTLAPASSRPVSVSPMVSSYQPHDNNPQPQVSKCEEQAPAIPGRNNIRNRVELDSNSPAVQRPNPMDDPVSPITTTSPTRANFSYPARQPPLGVPRQIASQYSTDIPPLPTQQPQYHEQTHHPVTAQPSTYQEHAAPTHYPTYQVPAYPALGQEQTHQDPSRPAPLRISHEASQRQSTMGNLKAAAHGIHGAGETLRGTLNNTLDRRNPAAQARHQAIIDAGMQEINNAHFIPRKQQNAIPPVIGEYGQYGVPPTLPHGGSAGYVEAEGGGSGGSGGRGQFGAQEGTRDGAAVGGLRSGGKMSGFVKKLKEGPLASKP